MESLKLFDMEYKFMNIVWEHEPVNSTELAKICLTELNWKKPTMYSMIKRLCERGIMKNEKATVTTLIKREQVQKYEADLLLNTTFGGSVLTLFTLFLKEKTLSEIEAHEIKEIIDTATKR